MTYRPNIQWQLQLGSAWTDVLGDAYSYSVKYGPEAGADGLVRAITARGELNLYDGLGKYNSESDAALNEYALRRIQNVRMVVDGVTVWQGKAEPPDSSIVPGAHRRAIFKLIGTYDNELKSQQEFSYTAATTDQQLWLDLMQAAGITSIAGAYNNTPTGVVIRKGTTRSLIDLLARFGDAYPFELHDGRWRYFAPRAGAAEGTTQLGTGNGYDVFYPLIRHSLRIKGIRNSLSGEVLGVKTDAEEDIARISETVPRGEVVRRRFEIDDPSIVACSAWRALLSTGAALSQLSVESSGPTSAVVEIDNTAGASDLAVDGTLRAVPVRTESLGQVQSRAQHSIDEFGLYASGREQPNWWSFAGQTHMNQIVDRLEFPLEFVRMRIMGWTDTQAAAQRIYGIRAGDIEELILDGEGDGEPDIALNMLVLAVRYVGRLSRIPEIELDLIELPISYGSEVWDLLVPAQRRLGITTRLG